MKIIPFEERYREDVRAVCRATTSDAFRTPKGDRALMLLYCDYYLDFHPDTTLIAVDEASDRAVGYVMCAPDFADYAATYRKHYLPRLRKECGWRYDLMKRGDFLYSARFAKAYPAHLHIDILPEAQRQGLGHRLIDALVAVLRQRGVGGVFLNVSATNEKGVGFYRKYGFRPLEKKYGGIVFGLKTDLDKAESAR